MNEDLKRIWTRYFLNYEFDIGNQYSDKPEDKRYLKFTGKFTYDAPEYIDERGYHFFKHKNCWIKHCGYFLGKHEDVGYKYAQRYGYELMAKEIEPRLEYFDYFKHKKIFHEFKDKRKLQIIYLALRKKIPFLSIFLILSFVRVIDLGHIM